MRLRKRETVGRGTKALVRVVVFLPVRAAECRPDLAAEHQPVRAADSLPAQAEGCPPDLAGVYQRARAEGYPQALGAVSQLVPVEGCQRGLAGVSRLGREAECRLARRPIEAIFPLGLSSLMNSRREGCTKMLRL